MKSNVDRFEIEKKSKFHTLYFKGPSALNGREFILKLCKDIQSSIEKARVYIASSGKDVELIIPNLIRYENEDYKLMRVGKYKDEFAKDVLLKDPSYLVWYFNSVQLNTLEKRYLKGLLKEIEDKVIKSNSENTEYIGKEGDFIQNILLKVVKVNVKRIPINIFESIESTYITLEDKKGNRVVLKKGKSQERVEEGDRILIRKAKVSRTSEYLGIKSTFINRVVYTRH